MMVHIFWFIFLTTIKTINTLCVTKSVSYIISPNTIIYDKKLVNNLVYKKNLNRRNVLDKSLKSNEHIIKLTDTARKKIKQLVAENEVDNLILRLCVTNGGCKGLKYKLDPIKKEEIEDDDYIQQFDELNFILSIDATSIMYIYNNILDYSCDLINGGFKFINPNATKKCGCGKSFNL
ncbi:iron-sulfur assembly protein, putative [Hepatocystis sp. ex Piliocolobus tephrosceles]|nr:iron-sulfur assembly protein, putative [Hepatocystis sp. ex Piliocolobus tephrosceles]